MNKEYQLDELISSGHKNLSILISKINSLRYYWKILILLLGLVLYPITFPIGIFYLLSYFPKRAFFVVIGTFLSFLFFASVWAYTPENEVETTNIVSQQREYELDRTSNLGNESIQEVSPTTPPQEQGYKVTKIVDGDTIDVINEDGKTMRIRLIGIDTPEVGKCLFSEASQQLSKLIKDKTVNLEADNTQNDKDKYDRYLRYINFEGVDINKLMIEQGFAKEYTYNVPYIYQKEFIEAQNFAKSKNLGLWGGACKCEQDAVKTSSCVACNTRKYTYTNYDCSTYTQNKKVSGCTNQCQKTSTRTGSSGGTTTTKKCLYSCSSPDRDCSDFSTHAQAQNFFNCCGFTATNDPMRLDSVGVGDGIACESLP